MAFLKNLLLRKQKKLSEKNLKEKTVNVLVMGKVAVGKTSLVRRLVEHEEQFADKHIPTVYDDMVKDVNVEGCKVTFKFMELGGKHPFPTMLEVFIKEAHVYLLVYAADDEESHSALIKLREQIVNVKGKCYSELSIIVARNKVDAGKRRSRKEKIRRKSVANWCYQHHDVSAKTGLKTNAIMDVLIEESKFIGNEQPDESFTFQEVSGRYIYTGKKKAKNPKWFKMFSHQQQTSNRLDRKNCKRLGFRRSQNRSTTSSEMFVHSPSQMKRSLSLPSLRQSFRKLRRKNNIKGSLPVSASFDLDRDLERNAVGSKRRSCTWPEPEQSAEKAGQLSDAKKASMEERDKSIDEGGDRSRTTSIQDDTFHRNDSGLRFSIDSKTRGSLDTSTQGSFNSGTRGSIDTATRVSVNSGTRGSVDSATRGGVHSFVRGGFDSSFRGSTRRSSIAYLDKNKDNDSTTTRRGSGFDDKHRASSTRRKSTLDEIYIKKSDSIHEKIKSIESDTLPKRSSLYQKRTEFANKKQKSVTLSTGDDPGCEKPQPLDNELRRSFHRKSSTAPQGLKSLSTSTSHSSSLSQESTSIQQPRRVSSMKKETTPLKKNSSNDENVFFPTPPVVLDCEDGPMKSRSPLQNKDGKSNKADNEVNTNDKTDLGLQKENELPTNNFLKPISRSQIPWMRLKSLSQNNVQNIENRFTVNRPLKFPEKKHSAIFKSSWGSFRCDEKRSSFGLKDLDKNGSLEGSKSSFGQELQKLVAKGRCTSFTNKRDAANRMKVSSPESQSNTQSEKQQSEKPQSEKPLVRPPLRKKDSYSLNDIRFIPSRYED